VPLAHVYVLACHLVRWRRARVIGTVLGASVYAVAPRAPLAPGGLGVFSLEVVCT
jgi:hypothetical protein